MKKHNLPLLVAVGVLIIITLACGSTNSSGDVISTPKPGESTPIITTPQDMRLELSLLELYNYYNGMTHLQRSEYLKTLDGKTVEWTGLVHDVDNKGLITISAPIGNCSVSLSGVPIEEAKNLNKGTQIRFTGTILEPRGPDSIGLCILLMDVQIIK